MSQETLTMTEKERRRLVVMERCDCGELLLKEAAWEMGVCGRQAIRIRKSYRVLGDEGLVHAARGVPSNRGHAPDFKRRVIETYREHYPDFGPTLAAEKMAEREGIVVNRETLRRWLIEAGLWRVGMKPRVHRTKRPRCERFGQMLQIDGSDHAWFEDRAEKSTLMVLIDDATGQMALHMAEAETTRAAQRVLHKWVRRYGVPGALYADRRTAYFSQTYLHDRSRRDDPAVFTQFMRSADRLGIEMIPAYSAQAKGRVERAILLLQDRLVKELRLRGISTIGKANAMLDAYAQDLGRRFAHEPMRPADAHRTPPKGRWQWEYCFSTEQTRTVQHDNTVVVHNKHWQILEQEGGPRPGQKVVRRTPLNGREPYWVFGGKRLKTQYLGPTRPRAA